MIHRGVMALIVCLAACESRYGTYLEIDGEQADVEFERVELYFGLPYGTVIPATPSSPEPQTGAVYKRMFVPSDVAIGDKARSSLSFYIPDSEENLWLGDYVLAIAYAGDTPVGIGELKHFKVEAGSVVRTYELVLQRYDGASVEHWGAGDGLGPCVRWSRQAPTGEHETVAVVRAEDVDCDGLKAEREDCDDLSFCGADGNGCTGTRCVDRETCGLGVCVSGESGVTCAVDTCVVPSVCDVCGDAADSELLACALERAPSHTIITIPTSMDQQASTKLCAALGVEYSFTLPGGIPCTSPEIVAPPGGKTPDGFIYNIIDGGAVCFLKVIPSTPEINPTYGYDDVAHHVVLALKRIDLPEPRSTVLLGIQPSAPGETHLPCGSEVRVSNVVDEYGLCQ